MGTAATGNLAALRIPTYRNLLVGRFVSGIGNWFLIVGLGWVVMQRTSDPPPWAP